MKIHVTDKSITRVSSPVFSVLGGVVKIDLNLHCDHSQAAVISSDKPFRTYQVVCLGCRGAELSEEDADSLIETFMLESIK